MKYLKQLLLLALVSSTILISCKDSKKEDSGDEFPEFLHFVWQDEEFDDGDELGVYFSADSIGSWDYFGDEYDQGEDCYFAMFVAEIVSYKGDEYRIRYNEEYVFPGENLEETIDLEVDGNELTVTAEVDGQTIIVPYSKDSRTVSDFTPICEELSFKAKAELESKRQKILEMLSQ